MVYHAGLPTTPSQRGIELLLIIDVELLLFGFRIYVQLDAESSDVRPADRGDLYVDGRVTIDEPVENVSEARPTAYDFVDDRVFDLSPDAIILPPPRAATRSHPWHDSVGRSSV